MTIPIAENVTADGTTEAVQVTAGRYMFAVGGTFDGASVTFTINVGPAVSVPIAGMTYTEPKAEVVWLPSCTVFITTSLTGASTNIGAAIAPVLLDVA